MQISKLFSIQRLGLFILIVLSAFQAQAGNNITSDKRQGSGIMIGQGPIAEDSKYQYMTSNVTTWAGEFQNVNTKNIVRLVYEESARTYYNSAWGVEVVCDVQRYDAFGSTASLPVEQCTLQIGYDPIAGSKYTDNTAFITGGGYRMEVTVTAINYTGSIAAMPADVILEAEIETERYWFFSLAPGLQLLSPANAPVPDFSLNATDNTLEFMWNFTTGAEEYDLEWVFLSAYSTAGVDFSKATRVTVSDNHYKINLVYDKGSITYRVRSVGRTGTNFDKRAEGAWAVLPSSIPVENLEQLDISDDKRNWQYTASYAEEGKRKEVISFFDGSLRNRQAVTKLNTENAVLISETLYDYEGRASVQTLPAPDHLLLRSSQLKFYTNYSLNTNAALYSRRDFDNDNLYTGCVLTGTPGMNTASGASNYYSSLNPDKEGFNAAIPDAGEYPFTQTQYGNDGRIRAQSGVGEDHTLSSTHQTNYFYATPSQEKLDRIFGSEAGYNKHYSEKLVQDANGQVSVSFEDLSGKVVATALAGEKPANMDALSSYGITTITEDFSNMNEYNATEEAWYIRNKIPVTSAGTQYDFVYTMTPAQYKELCLSLTKDCKYDLHFTVWDDQCNEFMEPEFPGVTVTDISGPGDYPGFPTPVIISNTNLTATFSVIFPRVGTYTIEKKITLNQAELQQAVADFQAALLASPTCITPLTTLQTNLNNTIEGELCECDDWCEQNWWKDSILVLNDALVFVKVPKYADGGACEKAECYPLTAAPDGVCDVLLDHFIEDMSLDGQYFDNVSPGSTAAPTTTWLETYVWPNSCTTCWAAADFRDAQNVQCTTWAMVRANWKDEFATKQFSPVVDNTCVLPLPCSTFNFNLPFSPAYPAKNQYGSLIEFHPEYCAYEWCKDIHPGKVFDMYVSQHTTLAWAESSPASNPHEPYPYSPNSTYKFIDATNIPIGKNMLDADPYFKTGGIGNGQYTAMLALLTDNGHGGSGYFPSGTLSMWDEAGHIAQNTSGCSGIGTTCDTHWQAFVSLYMTRKAEFMQQLKEGPSRYCFAPCDGAVPATNPTHIDNNASNCAYVQHGSPPAGPSNDWLNYVDASTNTFEIKTPDNFFALQQLQNNPSGAGTHTATVAAATNLCRQAASVTTNWSSINYNCGPNVSILATSGTLGFTDIPISSGTCCVSYQSVADLVAQVAIDINNYSSSPDFTAEVDPLDPVKLIIYAPSLLGVTGNSITLKVINCQIPPNSNPTFPMINGLDDGPCPEMLKNCFCEQLTQMATVYNTTNPVFGTPEADSDDMFWLYVDHTQYPTLTSYIVASLNEAHGLPSTLPPPAQAAIISTQVDAWLANCANNGNTDPEVGGPTTPSPGGPDPVLLPAAIDCNPPRPCPDYEDAYDITGFWAQQLYNQAVTAATQTFVAAYKARCLGFDKTMPPNAVFTESMNVTHPDREYHYTLYYYDQAGNLVHTVPPAGVVFLNTSEMASVKTFRNSNGNSGTAVFPLSSGTHHRLITNYIYNTLDQVIQQVTPDAGFTQFFYDKVGRIVASQNAKQHITSSGVFAYSYTLYDGQGRIKEVGQMSRPFNQMSQAIAENPALFMSFYNNATREQITRTYYDEPKFTVPALTQDNLRQRVASVTIEHKLDDNDDFTYEHATHYSYDIHGNVSTLVQDNFTLPSLSRYNNADYDYDLVSGNVNEVHFQDGKADQLHHKYQYDADNRITKVFTSKDKITWDNDAKYFYYLHGPMARTEIGDRSVQGMDYAYTIQGWMKGVNSNQLAKAGLAHNTGDNPDIGRDAVDDQGGGSYLTAQADLHAMTAADAYGFTLGYYENGATKDYKPISTTIGNLTTDIVNPATNITGNDLFNGNIKQMATALMKPNVSALPSLMPLIANQYRYDQLNRLTTVQAFLSPDPVTSGNYNYSGPGTTHTGDFDNSFTYDANGNILTQVRNGTSAVAQDLDDLQYFYWDDTETATFPSAFGSNKLAFVSDAVAGGNYPDDIDNHTSPTGNYHYDKIGNLISDVQEEIKNIEWTVYGKVKKITRFDNFDPNPSSKPDLEFAYDASGNRVMKIVKPRNAGVLSNQDFWTYTYYVRDAQGNILATYNKSYANLAGSYNEHYSLKERNIYGSSRLGITTEEIGLVNASFTNPGGLYNPDGTFGNITGYSPNNVAPAIGPVYYRELGNKFYEATNHLQNVLTTVSDRKLPEQTTPPTTLVAFYLPDVVSTTDYSAFGAPQPGRTFSSSNYRYGFNGQEKDDEVSGTGNIYTAMFWEYDARLGRRWNLDPKPTAGISDYACFNDNPILYSDINGDKAGGDPDDVKGEKKKETKLQAFTKKTLTAFARMLNKGSGNKLQENVDDKNVTAVHLFYQWIMGTGKNRRKFDENSVMGKQMLQAPEVEEALDNMKTKAMMGDKTPQTFARSLSQVEEADYAQSFVEDAGGNNPARAFQGSFSGDVTTDLVLPLENGGMYMVMTVTIQDNMTAISGTRFPPSLGGYDSGGGSAIYPEENPYGAGGQFRTIKIAYVMTVRIFIPAEKVIRKLNKNEL